MKPLVAAVFLLAAVAAPGQPLPSREVQNYSLEANTFLDALLKASAEFEFPLGVEWVKSAETLTPVRSYWGRATAADVIQELVSMQAGYEWRLEDGVVHVFNTVLLGDSRNPLNAKLPSYGFSDCRPIIARMAEVYLELNLRGVVAPKVGGGFGVSIGSGIDEPKIQFKCPEVSARYVLNKIVAVSDQHIWFATFPERIALTPTGFLEEVPTMLPGSDQPFWVLRRWGHPPPEKPIK